MAGEWRLYYICIYIYVCVFISAAAAAPPPVPPRASVTCKNGEVYTLERERERE